VLGLVRQPTACQQFEFMARSTSTADFENQNIEQLWSAGDDTALSSMRSLNLGYVLQSGGLIPYLSVGENIELPRRIAGLQVSRSETVAAMEALGLHWGYQKAVSDLSGGERQRVAILRAISHHPRLILADEPTAAVDSQRAATVVSLLAEMASTFGSAVLMVSHDHILTASVATRLLRLSLQEPSGTGATVFSAAPEPIDLYHRRTSDSPSVRVE